MKKVNIKSVIKSLLYLLAIVIYTTGVVLVVRPKNTSTEVYKYPHKCEALLKFNAAKYELVETVDSIILSEAPNSSLSGFEIVNKATEYNIDLIFILAQGKLESNFGTSGLAIKTNSVWNVGAFDSLSHNKIHKNYKYSNPNQSIEPYLELLTDRYLSKGKVELQLLENYVDINDNRYASDKNYEHKLTEIYYRYKMNTSINEKILKYTKYKLLYESY